MLTALQDTLPTDTSAAMPETEADGTYFITGDYYSDESYLTDRLREDGSYGGHLLIDNALNMDFIGNYENGILTVKQIDNYSDCLSYEIEIFFRNGKATVTITAADEEYFIKVGENLIVDRSEKPRA